MGEGVISEVEQRLRSAAETVGRQASLVHHQTEVLSPLPQVFNAILEGADDPEAQTLPAQWEHAVRMTGEAAELLSGLQAKITAYIGALAVAGGAGAGAASESTPATTTPPETKKPAPPELEQTVAAKRIRQELKRKIFFFKRHQTATPENAEDEAAVANLVKIDENISSQVQPESELLSMFADFIRNREAFDPFSLEDKARHIVDTLLEGAGDSLDMADLFMVHAGFRRLQFAAYDEINMPSSQEKKTDQQVEELKMAVNQEIIRRVDPDKIAIGREIDYQRTYDQVCEQQLDPALRQDLSHELYGLQEEVWDHVLLDFFIPRYIVNENTAKTDYNRPMSKVDKTNLDTAAAATMEGIHLLKTYGVTPMVIEGSKVGLSWDIAIVPPVPPSIDAPNPEGAVADFLFLWPKPPGEERTLMEMEQDPDDPMITSVTADGGGVLGRYRLHDDGHISYGGVVHNVPSDHTERQFSEGNADAAFTRLRSLFIAMAFDALVPEDVIREQAGGSVASQYNRPDRRPSSEPLTALLLQRQRVLERAQVSDRNRQPTGWEWPTKVIGGYMRKLPEGYKARPGAEDEARQYYKDRGWKFEGLPEGKTFVREFKRGTGPARTTFRRAAFGPRSKTRGFLRGK